MKHAIPAILIVLLLTNSLYAETNNTTIISDITSRVPVLEEWKNPGLYSPVNIIDGKSDTCCVVRKNKVSIRIKFVKPVKIDEIKIMNGFDISDKYFYENNRISNCTINLFVKDKMIGEENLILKDQKGFQSIKLKKEYLFEQFNIYNESSDKQFKGSKYNDYCITEIEFYYEGKKIEINNIDELQKNYIKQINHDLNNALSDHEYILPNTCHGAETCAHVKFSKDGTIVFTNDGSLDPGDGGSSYNMSDFFPKFWKIENNKLFMRDSNKSKWKLYRYEILKNEELLDRISQLIIYPDPPTGKKEWYHEIDWNFLDPEDDISSW